MIITNELLVKSARKPVFASFEDDMKRIITLMLLHNVSMIPFNSFYSRRKKQFSINSKKENLEIYD